MLINAEHALAWLKQAGIDSPKKQCIAITENQSAALAWGISPERILPVWAWVGGRFSVWSLMSFPIIMAYGFEVFDALLTGAHLMDQHVMSAPWQNNMPALLALIDYWYRTYFGLNNLAIIPYEFSLRSIIPHLQQLHMESLGKPGQGSTGGLVWGALGSHAQHTFNQLLQQGTEIVPIDFILSQQACLETPALEHHCLAQRESLMTGHASINPHAVLPGNRPSNLIRLESLCPENIGSLLALYEHKITILAQLYGVNAFDQFGVEYSKELARQHTL
jgi:glucose-6-phosphate isomerase